MIACMNECITDCRPFLWNSAECEFVQINLVSIWSLSVESLGQ